MDDFDKLIANMDSISIKFKSMRKELVEEVGELVYNTLMKNIDSTVGGEGTLKSGQEKKVGSGKGYVAVKPNYKIAPHTHLVENGHKGKNGKGWVYGKHFYLNTHAQVEAIIKEKCGKVVEQVKDGFR